jgi:hypothetical protein
MNRIWKWLTTPLMLSIYLLFWVVVDLIIIGRASGLDAGQWASWVQAVGSILAIAGAAWAALHTIASARQATRDNEREAAKSHLIFIRAVLTQSSYAVDNLRDSIQYYNPMKIEHNAARIAACLTSIESAINRTGNEHLTRILADAYERLSICRAHALGAAGPNGFDRAHAEIAATVNKRLIDDLLAELETTARSWGMQPAPEA